MPADYMQNNVYKICTGYYVTMYIIADMFNVHTICSEVIDSVHNESARVQFSSAIYCFCVLTEQHRDRRDIKYKQQTERHRQQVITNHTIKITEQIYGRK
jgi:hypothetical protein